MTEDLTSLVAELHKLVEVLGESETAKADAEKVRADAEKTRADADKVLADTEVVRASTQVDLESKQIANAKARADNDAARIDKLISQVTGAVPDISSLSKSTVTLTEGAVLRQGEATGVALGWVARDIVHDLAHKLAGTSITALYVVSNTDLLADIVTYQRIRAEAEVLRAAATQAKTDADAALIAAHGSPGRGLAGPGSSLVLASLAGAVTKQVASLFEFEVSVATDETSVPAMSVHAAVLNALLAHQLPNVSIHHEYARIPPEGSGLMSLITELISSDIDLAQIDATLDYAIKKVGDPAGELAAAKRTLQDKNVSQQDKEAAERIAADAPAKIEQLAVLTKARVRLAALADKIRAFSDRITTASSSAGVSVLATSIAVEAIASVDSSTGVLIVGAGKVESSQLVAARRVFRPRLQASVALSVDYFLVQSTETLAAGRASRSVSYMGVVKGDGIAWKQIQAADWKPSPEPQAPNTGTGPTGTASTEAGLTGTIRTGTVSRGAT